jgi:CrcB protein
MITALIVLGGGLGAVLRWLVTLWLGTTDRGFPLGTTVVNVVGSFALGVAVGMGSSIAEFDTQPLTVGLLGGFTTFSTWMVQIADQDDRRVSDAIAIIPTVVGVMFAAGGVMLGRVVVG